MLDAIYKSVLLGLVAAGVMLVATRRAPEAPPAPAELTVVDVARPAAAGRVLDLIGLRPGERVIAIADRAAGTDDVVAAWRELSANGYLDLTLERGGHNRRVLLLAHR